MIVSMIVNFFCYFRCAIPMRERKRASAGSDGVCWSCTQCKTNKSIRKGSFFEKSKMRLFSWLIGMWWWVREYPVGLMADEAGIGEDRACNMYQWLRKVCTQKLLQAPITLAGPGIIVQIDQSQFRHKPKVGNESYVNIDI